MVQPFAGQISDDLKSFYELAERFAKKELEPKALELDRYPYSEFNWQALTAANETGLLKLVVAEALGGSGQGMSALSIILSRLAQADASFAAVIFINALAQAAVEKWADKQVAQKALKNETSAASSLLAFPVYAPPADLPLEVKAAKGKDGYVLDGGCSMLALAPVAYRMIIPAEINNSGKASFFLLDKSEPGIKVGDPLLTLGLHNCPVADVTLQGVEAGPENLLGGEGRAGEEFPGLSARFGGPLAALAHGVLLGSFQAATTFARDRYQGGKQIIDHDQVRVMLANMAVLIEVAGAACMNASRSADAGDPSGCLAAATFVTDAVTRATTDGVQCLGGYGYMHDYGQEKRMRDAKQIQAVFGPSTLKRLEFLEKRLREE
jgi:alkylation response protein AidB-like acyl-CoA dehydrogenase